MTWLPALPHIPQEALSAVGLGSHTARGTFSGGQLASNHAEIFLGHLSGLYRVEAGGSWPKCALAFC